MNHINRSNYKTEQEYRQAWIACFEIQNRALVSSLIKRAADNVQIIVNQKIEKNETNYQSKRLA